MWYPYLCVLHISTYGSYRKGPPGVPRTIDCRPTPTLNLMLVLITFIIYSSVYQFKWELFTEGSCPNYEHGRVMNTAGFPRMIEVFGARAGGPIRRGMTLQTANEIAGLVVFWP